MENEKNVLKKTGIKLLERIYSIKHIDAIDHCQAQLMAYYLAVKIMRNNMNHAVERGTVNQEVIEQFNAK